MIGRFGGEDFQCLSMYTVDNGRKQGVTYSHLEAFSSSVPSLRS